MKPFFHIPVLLKEAVDALNVEKGGKYIDATAGGGGHTSSILEKGGNVLAIDKDEDAVEILNERLKGKKAVVVYGNFKNIEKIAKENGFEKANGVIFDLGVSSYQLDSSKRGFSIRHDELLDMRMDKSSRLSAYDIVNRYSKSELTEIFYRYGEEHNAEKIAISIIEARKKKEIGTTKELAELIEKISHRSESIHPATRVFQAIRIEVNDELGAISLGIKGADNLLTPSGKLVVISFHSLEDRIVKKLFDQFQKEGKGRVATKKPLVPSFEEKKLNKRARSAKMRVFEKI